LTITMVPVGDGAEAAGLALVPERTATVLVVSAGFATAEQLARAAMLAADSGSMVMGIIVADPDPADQTTGSSEDPTVTVLSAHKRTPTQLQRSAT
jgi:Mrp family chromosome partitioning ATPase